MMLEREANALFANLIRDYGLTIGFDYVANDSDKYAPPVLMRKTNSGIDLIGDLYLEFFNNKLLMTSAFSKRVHAIENIWTKYYLMLNAVGKSFDPSVLVTVASNSKRISDYVFDANNAIKWIRTNDRSEVESSEEGIKKLFNQFVMKTEKYVLPTLLKYDTLTEIDRAMNEKPDTYFECIHLFTGNGLIFKKMIVAKLSGNPYYPEVCSSMKNKILGMEVDLSHDVTKYLEVWEKLMSELEIT